MKFIVFSLPLFALLLLIPQIVFADDDLRKFLTPIQDSNYVIFAQMEIRDSSEQLTGVIIPRSYYYLDHQLTEKLLDCLLYTSPSPRDLSTSRMPSSA